MADRSSSSPLARGFYTVGDAARLIPNASSNRIYNWLNPYHGEEDALISREYDPIANAQELSFLDLMEVRFVEYFRNAGVSVRSLRKAAERARKYFHTDKPFATSDFSFVTDGKSLFVESVLKPAAREADDKTLWGLLTEQYEMYGVIKESLLQGVQFNPKSKLAETWRPRPRSHPHIIIDPKVAFGQPTFEARVTTAALYDAWFAENENLAEVAYWFELPETAVREAIQFERQLRERKLEAA
jgi:uncharacterized protein (DUF433 family)